MLRLGSMQHKSEAPAQPLLELPFHRLLRVSGPDAMAFAKGQFMNDPEALAEGEWHWSGWLTPKGRVIALFAVLRQQDGLLLLLPDADPRVLGTALARFVFRAKVSLALPAARVTGRFAAPARASGPRTAVHDGVVELDMGGAAGPRTLYIALDRDADPRPAEGDGSHDWALADLAHGLPRLPADAEPQWTPQQLSLERLDAFSVRKGCYPGQEIVARTHFLGKAKRGLVLLEADVPVAVGAEVHAGDATAGTVASAASAGGRNLALAVMPLERGDEALVIGSRPVRALALEDGLARPVEARNEERETGNE